MLHRPIQLAGKRVVVMGLGQFGGGAGVARYCVAQGASVLVTDTAPAEKLSDGLARLKDLPIAYRLGMHLEDDFTSADVVVVNPAVKQRDNRYITAAVNAGVQLTSEIRLLVGALPNRLRTIAITGTAGKSTVTAMIGQILRQTQPQRVRVGGNIGGSMLDNIGEIRPDDWIVLELSSFMLQGLREDHWSPHVAVITNFSPNHLDWHRDLEEYRFAKQAIWDHQSDADGDSAVGGPGVRDVFQCRVRSAVMLDEWRDSARGVELLIPGEHNRLNAIVAAAAVECAAGLPVRDGCAALRDFPGLPHRLQLVGERAGVRYFNDSKSTTPDAALLAIESFAPGVLHVILGGYDKGSDMAALARAAAQRCRAIYTIGKTGPAIAAAAVGGPAEIVPSETLDHAVAQTVGRVRDGDVVLLSPACASWDQFTNFEQRGAAFVEAVLKYTGEGAAPPQALMDGGTRA